MPHLEAHEIAFGEMAKITAYRPFQLMTKIRIDPQLCSGAKAMPIEGAEVFLGVD